MRLIDADALKENIPNTNVDIFENCRNCNTLMDWQVKELIDKMPTIDAVDVVRCKDCKYFEPFRPTDGFCNISGMINTLEFFCADAKRKE